MSLESSNTHQPAVNSVAINQDNSVRVTKAADEWIVSVVEEGEVGTVEFLIEAHALIFAAGQRVRMGLPVNRRRPVATELPFYGLFSNLRIDEPGDNLL